MEDGREDVAKVIGNDVGKARSKEAVILFLIIAAAIVIGMISLANSGNSSTRGGEPPAPFTSAKQNQGGYATVDGQRQPSQSQQIATAPAPRPYALVALKTPKSSDPDEAAGETNLMQTEIEEQLPNVIGGLNALCPEIQFGATSANADYVVLFIPKDVDSFAAGVERTRGDSRGKVLLGKTYSNPISAYTAACGAIRRDLKRHAHASTSPSRN